MKVEIVLGDEFKRQFKRLAKKYPSLKDDFITFKKELADDPFQGSDLGNGTRKVRMAIATRASRMVMMVFLFIIIVFYTF